MRPVMTNAMMVLKGTRISMIKERPEIGPQKVKSHQQRSKVAREYLDLGCSTSNEAHVLSWVRQYINKNQTEMGAQEDKLKGNWNQIKGKLKQQYGDLTDDDLTYTEGKEDEMYGRLQEKLGKSKDEVKHMIDGIGSGK